MRYTLKIILIMFALLSLLGFAVLFLPGSNQCHLENLILKDVLMPMRWARSGYVLPPVLPKQGAEDALGVVYEMGNNIAQHKIYQYKNGFVASLALWINNQVFFPSGSWDWFDIQGSEDWELTGDVEKIRCGESNDPSLGYLCVAAIRYGPYISEFSSPIEEGVMSQEEFKAIVIAIDNKIASCIQSPNHQR